MEGHGRNASVALFVWSSTVSSDLPGRLKSRLLRVTLIALQVAGIAVAMPAVAAAQSPPSPAAPTPPPAPGATPARTFTAPVGLLFNTVRPDRVADFEKVMAYLQAALEKSADAKDRAQLQGWRVFKAAEPGPGGTALYVFVIDPTVPGADYGLGRILAEAYPDTAQLQEIWKLYSGAVTSGGSLLNLSPVKPGAASLTPGAPASSPTPERPLPPDADPNRR